MDQVIVAAKAVADAKLTKSLTDSKQSHPLGIAKLEDASHCWNL